ncbi:hypothetical protein T10_10352 [Trichinella papuae]|uniref:Uncharacterized protein n=1 Tax=Trichinella papuae TaxID=268474 RepID=A0A0V1MBE7_9BILA|nr:hypothetical protein T10_10352 [Trichinella papuae]
MHRFSKHFELFDDIDPQYKRYYFEKTSPLMCMIKFGPSHEGSPGCAIAAVYFGLMWNNVDNHSPPYADTVIGPNSQQWVGSQDEWLSHTLKESIFDVIKVLWCTELSISNLPWHIYPSNTFHFIFSVKSLFINLKPFASQLAVCTCSFSKREAQFTFRINLSREKLDQEKTNNFNCHLKIRYGKTQESMPRIFFNVNNATHYCILTRSVACFSRNYNEQLVKGSVENAK